MILQRLVSSVVMFVLVFATSQLNAQYGASSTQRDTVVGGAAGAIIGGIIGNQNDETPEGIAIGGAVGAIAGNLLGKSKDAELQRQWQYQQQAQRYQQQLQNQRAYEIQKAATVNDVIAMGQNGVSDQLIINHIRTNGVAQEIGVNEIIDLHRNGISELVINSMQKTANAGIAQPQPTVVNESPRFATPNVPAPAQRYVPYGGTVREIVPVVPVYRSAPIVVESYRLPAYRGPVHPRHHHPPRYSQRPRGGAGFSIEFGR